MYYVKAKKTYDGRLDLHKYINQGKTAKEIAQILGKDLSSIYKEIARNSIHKYSGKTCGSCERIRVEGKCSMFNIVNYECTNYFEPKCDK